eukprot:comp15574_c0_seq4/m.23873 comp15574_c0_seq4/g.23873  ORF comp15574_c0_seq4/g.23873 comp15574_c0_seq4/m.23873 type:complete len:150 (+) comp15574_c0_seq4:329-778(+)
MCSVFIHIPSILSFCPTNHKIVVYFFPFLFPLSSFTILQQQKQQPTHIHTQGPIAKNLELLDGRVDFTGSPDCCDVICSLPNTEYSNRRRVRLAAGIPQAPCEDAFCVVTCLPCVICQDQREIKLRYEKTGVVPTLIKMVKGGPSHQHR